MRSNASVQAAVLSEEDEPAAWDETAEFPRTTKRHAAASPPSPEEVEAMVRAYHETGGKVTVCPKASGEVGVQNNTGWD